MRSPDGHFIDPNMGNNGKEVADTVQCCHCGMHLTWTKKTWKQTGWCINCQRIRCQKKECQTCCHWEKRMEKYEKMRHEKRRIGNILEAV